MGLLRPSPGSFASSFEDGEKKQFLHTRVWVLSEKRNARRKCKTEATTKRAHTLPRTSRKFEPQQTYINMARRGGGGGARPGACFHFPPTPHTCIRSSNCPRPSRAFQWNRSLLVANTRLSSPPPTLRSSPSRGAAPARRRLAFWCVPPHYSRAWSLVVSQKTKNLLPSPSLVFPSCSFLLGTDPSIAPFSFSLLQTAPPPAAQQQQSGGGGMMGGMMGMVAQGE
jgi:hypothetical protein